MIRLGQKFEKSTKSVWADLTQVLGFIIIIIFLNKTMIG